MNINQFKKLIEEELLPNIILKSPSPNDPIIVDNQAKEWQVVGSGNFASVFAHPSQPSFVVKVYGRDLEAIKEEIHVYEKLGDHNAYSKLYGYGQHYLILKRIHGITLYDAMLKGIAIPPQVIEDIEEAMVYAKERDLNPFDVHGKNIVMNEGKGIIVDVSDFYKTGICKKMARS